MLSLCNSSIYNYVTSKYYDSLNNLSPIKRASEIVRLEIENLSLELKDDDEIFGWFIFNNNHESKQFSDRILSEDDKKTMDAPILHGSLTSVDKGHTLVDYEYILNNGLLAYQEKIDKELQTFSDYEYLLAMKSILESIKKLIDKMLRDKD